jgi:hypothetical protein
MSLSCWRGIEDAPATIGECDHGDSPPDRGRPSGRRPQDLRCAGVSKLLDMVGWRDSGGDDRIWIWCCMCRMSAWNWAELFKDGDPAAKSLLRWAVLGRGDGSGVSPGRGVNGLFQIPGRPAGRLTTGSPYREPLGGRICWTRSRAVMLGGRECEMLLLSANDRATGVWLVGLAEPRRTLEADVVAGCASGWVRSLTIFSIVEVIDSEVPASDMASW